MQRRTEIVEMLIGVEVLEGVVSTVLEQVKNGGIDEAIARSRLVGERVTVGG